MQLIHGVFVPGNFTEMGNCNSEGIFQLDRAACSPSFGQRMFSKVQSEQQTELSSVSMLYRQAAFELVDVSFFTDQRGNNLCKSQNLGLRIRIQEVIKCLSIFF